MLFVQIIRFSTCIAYDLKVISSTCLSCTVPITLNSAGNTLVREDPLEKGMATHSSILAWRMPWTEELGRLQSMGLQSQIQLSN